MPDIKDAWNYEICFNCRQCDYYLQWETELIAKVAEKNIREDDFYWLDYEPGAEGQNPYYFENVYYDGFKTTLERTTNPDLFLEIYQNALKEFLLDNIDKAFPDKESLIKAIEDAGYTVPDVIKKARSLKEAVRTMFSPKADFGEPIDVVLEDILVDTLLDLQYEGTIGQIFVEYMLPDIDRHWEDLGLDEYYIEVLDDEMSWTDVSFHSLMDYMEEDGYRYDEDLRLLAYDTGLMDYIEECEIYNSAIN